MEEVSRPRQLLFIDAARTMITIYLWEIYISLGTDYRRDVGLRRRRHRRYRNNRKSSLIFKIDKDVVRPLVRIRRQTDIGRFSLSSFSSSVRHLRTGCSYICWPTTGWGPERTDDDFMGDASNQVLVLSTVLLRHPVIGCIRKIVLSAALNEIDSWLRSYQHHLTN